MDISKTKQAFSVSRPISQRSAMFQVIHRLMTKKSRNFLRTIVDSYFSCPGSQPHDAYFTLS